MRMNDGELESYFDAHLVPQEARNYIRCSRVSDPSRRTGGKIKCVSTRFSSLKMGCVIQAESKEAELAYVIDLEFDPDVIEYYDQPPKVPTAIVDCRGRRSSRDITADYLVLRQSTGPEICECKTAESIEKLLAENKNWWVDATGEIHYEALRSWAARVGIRSNVVSSASISQYRIQNLMLLSDYLVDGAPQVDARVAGRIKELLHQNQSMSISQLMERANLKTGEPIYIMIAEQSIAVNFDESALADQERTLLYPDRPTMAFYESARDLSRQTVGAAQGCGFAQTSGGAHLESRQCRVVNDVLMQSSAKDRRIGAERAQLLASGHALTVVSKRTVQRWKANCKAADSEFGLANIGLIPQTGKRGNHGSKLSTMVDKIIDEVISTHYLVPEPKRRREFGARSVTSAS